MIFNKTMAEEDSKVSGRKKLHGEDNSKTSEQNEITISILKMKLPIREPR